MFDYSVEGNKLIYTSSLIVPLDSNLDKTFSDIKKDLFADWNKFQTIYCAERKKFLETLDNNHSDNSVADKPTEDKSVKVNLDTSQLDAAINKADKLIDKLKIANDKMNTINLKINTAKDIIAFINK